MSSQRRTVRFPTYPEKPKPATKVYLEVAPGIFASTYDAEQQYYLGQASLYQKLAHSADIKSGLESKNKTLKRSLKAALNCFKKLEDEPVELSGDDSTQQHQKDNIALQTPSNLQKATNDDHTSGTNPITSADATGHPGSTSQLDDSITKSGDNTAAITTSSISEVSTHTTHEDRVFNTPTIAIDSSIVNSLRENVACLESDLSTLREQRDGLEKTVARLESELNMSRNVCDDLRKNMASVESALAISSEQHNDANNKLAAADAAYVALAIDFTKYHDCNPLQSKIAELEQSIEELKTYENKQEKNASNFRLQLSQTVDTLKAERSDHESTRMRLREVSVVSEGTQNALLTLQSKHETLTQQHEELVAVKGNISQELSTLQTTHMSVVKAQEDAQRSLHENVNELTQTKQDLISAKAKIARVEASRDALDTADVEVQGDEADLTDSDTLQTFVSADDDTEPSGHEPSTPPTSPFTLTDAASAALPSSPPTMAEANPSEHKPCTLKELEVVVDKAEDTFGNTSLPSSFTTQTVFRFSKTETKPEDIAKIGFAQQLGANSKNKLSGLFKQSQTGDDDDGKKKDANLGVGIGQVSNIDFTKKIEISSNNPFFGLTQTTHLDDEDSNDDYSDEESEDFVGDGSDYESEGITEGEEVLMNISQEHIETSSRKLSTILVEMPQPDEEIEEEDDKQQGSGRSCDESIEEESRPLGIEKMNACSETSLAGLSNDFLSDEDLDGKNNNEAEDGDDETEDDEVATMKTAGL